MKKGVILFHKNIQQIYDHRWIHNSIDSILNQTDNNFTLYEINYGGDPFSVVTNKNISQHHIFWSKNLSNYAEAMNFILDKAFNDGCDYVFNTNLDDIYSLSRIEDQIDIMLKTNFDILSSDFCYIQEQNINNQKKDVIIKYMNIPKDNIFHHLMNRHNVIAHPAVCYNKNFWIDTDNRYNIEKTPEEDLDLWIRSIKRGYKFGIHEKNLLYYRIHNNQVSNR